MEAYVNYIEHELSGEKKSEYLYKFKRQALDEMIERANEITHTGLKDEKVISDLIISEYGNIHEKYHAYLLKEKDTKNQKRAVLWNIIGSGIYILSSLIIFLSVSFITGAWSKTWIIIEGALTLWLVYEFSKLIKRATKSKKAIFHPGARLLLAGCVMLITQLVFFIDLVIIKMPKSWLIFIFGVIVMFVADGFYVAFTKQRLAILNYLFYVIASSPMVYIILSALGVLTWSTGWIIIPLSVLIDLIIIAIKLIVRKSSASYEEVE